MQGKVYTSFSSKTVPQKSFVPSSSCCTKECFKIINIECQEKAFREFWLLSNYNMQNLILKNCLKLHDPVSINPTCKQRRLVTWIYLFSTEEVFYEVCKKFILSVYAIGEKRIRTIQNKILNHKTVNDERGQNNNHNFKLTDNVKQLILLHCQLIPHRQSHYSYECSSLKYFESSTINIKNLFKSFIDYYTAVTGEEIFPISESTYIKFFSHHSGFSFNMPRTDVSNICYESEVSGEIN